MSSRLGFFTLLAVITCGLVQADDPRETPLVRAVENCRSFVVNIHTEKNASDGESRFFGGKNRRVSGMGTGIVVDERGYIVTNYHVIHDVDTITVTLKDGETVTARPVSYDRKHDMAIIRIEPTTKLEVMPMGASCDVRLAEQVFAVGNAFGYEYTVTAGIVSALSRDVEVDETQAYENLIQTDASINPGNSGGPLLNVRGEVIGINVAIRAGAQRIGFAIPIDDARVTIARLLSTQKLNGIAHGMTGHDVKTAVDQRLVVDSVSAGSSAARSGLKVGDVVESVRGIEVHDAADWERGLLDLPPGRVLDVVVNRQGTEVPLRYTVGQIASTPSQTSSIKAQTVSVSTQIPAKSGPRERVEAMFDIGLRELTAAETQKLKGTKFRGGMMVTSVSRTSAAGRSGILTGDILVGLNRWETLQESNLEYILKDQDMRKRKTMLFQVFRGRRSLAVNLPVQP